jgi:hypothetical protein
LLFLIEKFSFVSHWLLKLSAARARLYAVFDQLFEKLF